MPLTIDDVAPKPGEMRSVRSNISRIRKARSVPRFGITERVRSAWEDYRPS